MNRRITILIVAALFLATIPSFKTSASRSQTSPTKCTNADFLKGVGDDFTAIGKEIQATDMTNVSALSKTLIDTTTLRKKYEDQSDVKGCEDAQTSITIALANGTDLLALALATTADSKNAASYATDLQAQAARFQQSLADIGVSMGMATPSATAPTAQPPISCKDTSFLTGLRSDFQSMIDQAKAADMKDVASVTKALLGISTIRRKYEDLNFDSDDCLYAQYSIIVAFANASDLLALQVAADADPKNADTYTAALTDQGKRFGTSVQNVLVDLGLATPAPDATQAQ